MSDARLTFGTQPDSEKLTRIAQRLQEALPGKIVTFKAGGWLGSDSIQVTNDVGTVLYTMPVSKEGVRGGATQWRVTIPAKLRGELNWEGLGEFFQSQGAIEYPSAAMGGGYRRRHRKSHRQHRKGSRSAHRKSRRQHHKGSRSARHRKSRRQH